MTVSVLEGGWIVFDQIRLEGSDGLVLEQNNEYAFLRDVSPAGYEIELDGVNVQPLLVDVEHLSGNPELSVKLDGTRIFTAKMDTARYVFEVPMPAVNKKKRVNIRSLSMNSYWKEVRFYALRRSCSLLLIM